MTTTHGPTFTAPLPDLQTALAALAVVPAGRPPVPVLGGVVVDATDTDVTLSVFDYEASARVSVEGAQVKEPGRILLDRADLARVLRGATRGETKRSLTGWQAIITGRTVTSTIPADGETPERVRHISTAEVGVGDFEVPVECLPVDEFPSLPQPDEPNFSVDRDRFAAILAQVTTAAGTEAHLPALTGVRMEPGESTLTLACTDRFKLTVGQVAVEQLAPADGEGYLLPAAALMRAVKTLPPGPVTVGLTSQRSHALATVTASGVQITLRLLDAEFPKFRQLLPLDFATTVVVDRAQLTRAVDKATALGGRVGAVDLRVHEGQLTVVPRLDHVEEQRRARGALVPAACDGPDLVIGFTGSRLLDALGSIGTEQVALGLTSASKPMLIAATVEQLRDADAPFRHLLMHYGQPA